MRGRAVVVAAVAVLVAGLTGCGQDGTASVADEAAPSSAEPGTGPRSSASPADEPASTPTEQPSADAGPTGEPSAGAGPTGEPAAPPAEQPDTAGPDLDGDGRGDRVTLTEVAGMGWSFDVRLADGRETSAPLPDEEVVREDVALLGAVDLDRDGADEVLVRTLRAVGGENAVVFRLDGDGVWLVRTDDGAAWELATSGGMSGPRSYACTGGEVLTRESERSPDGTYRATTWRWTLRGHVAGPLGGQRDDVLPAEEVSLDPSTCVA